jgi:hypothetical protein
MQDEPTPEELIKAVADFLRNDIAPEISGHNAFKLRVSINALDLVTRQLALEEASDAAEAARLSQLLGMQGALGELNRVLAERIAKGELDLQTPGLSEHLWQTTLPSSRSTSRIMRPTRGRSGRREMSRHPEVRALSCAPRRMATYRAVTLRGSPKRARTSG